jgi:hypothetical protein
MHYFSRKEALFARATAAPTLTLPGGTAEEVAEQLLDRMHESLTDEPAGSLAVLRSMLTHPESAQDIRASARTYKDQIAAAIPGDDADLRAAIVSAAILGVVLGRHMIKLDHLADADPDQIVDILRPCVRTLTRAD